MTVSLVIGMAGLMTLGVVWLAIFFVQSSSFSAGQAQVRAEYATAEAKAENAVLAVANRGESDAQTLDSLSSGSF